MEFHNDTVIKLDYNRVLSGELSSLNSVGPTDSLTLRELDYTPTDLNTIFISASEGDDDTGDGTELNPYASVTKADSEVTADLSRIMILDSEVYTVKYLVFSALLLGIYAAIGCTPSISPEVEYTDDNYFVEETVSDTVISTGEKIYSRITTPRILTNGNVLICWSHGDGTAAANYAKHRIMDTEGNAIGIVIQDSHDATDITGSYAFDGFYVYAGRDADDNVLRIYCRNNDMSEKWVYHSLSCGGGSGQIGSVGDKIIVLRSHGGADYYNLFDYEGNLTYSSGSLGVVMGFTNIISTEDGGCVITGYQTGGTNVYVFKLNSSGVVTHTKTINIGDTGAITSFIDGDNLHISYIKSDDYYRQTITWSTLSDVTGETLFRSVGSGFPFIQDSGLLWDGNYYFSTSILNGIELVITDNNFNVLVVEQRSDSTLVYNRSVFSEYDHRLVTVHRQYTNPNYAIRMEVFSGFLWDWIEFQNSLTLNGIYFDFEGIDGIKTAIDIHDCSSLKISWCEFMECERPDYNDGDQYPLSLVNAVATSVDWHNSMVRDNDIGVKITSDDVHVHYSQFYKNLRGHGLHIVGAGSSIILNNIDLLYNYTGIRLEDNDGDEVVKNLTVYRNGLYGIHADTDIEVSYSCCADANSGVEVGTRYVQANPQYMKDGFNNPSLRNLNLKQKALGYRIDSPALELGDDGENAGAFIVEIEGEGETWDTVTIEKELININYNPIGNYEVPFSDGSISSGVDSFQKVLQIKYRGLPTAEYLKLLAVYFCKKSLVRVYLDPITNSGTYELYNKVFDKMSASTKIPKLSRSGVQDLELTFKRSESGVI